MIVQIEIAGDVELTSAKQTAIAGEITDTTTLSVGEMGSGSTGETTNIRIGLRGMNVTLDELKQIQTIVETTFAGVLMGPNVLKTSLFCRSQ